MAEKQTPTNAHNDYSPGEAARRLMKAPTPGFFARANEFRKEHPTATNIGAAAAILAVGVPVIVAEFTQPTPEQQAAAEQQIQEDYESDAYKDSVSQAINAFYDKDALVGNRFEVPQGGGLLEPAIKEVVATIGQDAYNKDQNDIYNALLNSSLLHNVQPGETYAVVETDFDPQNDNGIEYVTIEASHILADPNEPIPAPITR
jgi:hypothetical protein